MLFDTPNLRSTLRSLDWAAVVSAAADASEDWTPGVAYLAGQGEVSIAETAVEINGLPLVSATNQGRAQAFAWLRAIDRRIATIAERACREFCTLNQGHTVGKSV